MNEDTLRPEIVLQKVKQNSVKGNCYFSPSVAERLFCRPSFA